MNVSIFFFKQQFVKVPPYFEAGGEQTSQFKTKTDTFIENRKQEFRLSAEIRLCAP